MVLSLAFAAPAAAHARLLGTAPADGATVAEPVSAVILEFNQLVGLPELAVSGPDGQPLSLEPLPSEGQRFVQSLPPLAQTGVYTVTWRVVSVDRDPVEGQFSFTYAGPLASPPAAATPAPPEPAVTAEPAPSPAEEQPGPQSLNSSSRPPPNPRPLAAPGRS
ncbi:MAG: copper resistance CopC family protein [Egibacteraceae bacterium]